MTLTTRLHGPVAGTASGLSRTCSASTGPWLDLFAGPAGWDMGARILGIDAAIHGYDIDADACATATAAGFTRTRGDVRDLNPEDFPAATGLIASPPCPTWSASGKRSALQEVDYEAVLEALRRLGDAQAGLGAAGRYAQVYDLVGDERTALVVETLRFAFRLPAVRWVIAEQVPAVRPIWEEVCAELAAAFDFEYCAVVAVEATDLGMASRRSRVFLIATRYYTPDLSGLPVRAWWSCGRFDAPRLHLPHGGEVFAARSMAQVLGWPAGARVNTRGQRRTSGGNEFSADGPSWCVTEKARSWRRVSDGTQLTASQAGLLTGFPADYPWQGSRSKQFLQAADVVSPPVAAAVLGAALGIDWQQPVRDYLAQIYPERGEASALSYAQPTLFEEVVA